MPKIKARFHNMSKGRSAVDTLKQSGFSNAYLDAMDGLLSEFAEEILSYEESSEKFKCQLVVSVDENLLEEVQKRITEMGGEI